MKDELTQVLTYISPGREGVPGMRREHMYGGSSEEWLARIQGEDLAKVAEMLEKQRAGVKGDVEFRVAGAEGEIGWTRCRYFPVFNGAGRLIETVGVSEDLTREKNSRETLAQSYHDLWQVMSSGKN